MIYLYSGTPGSGKSLHLASRLYWWIRAGKPVICNFQINLDKIKSSKNKDFHYCSNMELTPDYLIKFAQDYYSGGKKVREGSILLAIDECQLMFNARDWSKSGRDKWLSFFTMHRHWGFDIILVAQFDRTTDRRIRSLIEYEFVHRKVSNYGWRGIFLSAAFLSHKLFLYVKVWYPMKEKVGHEFFRCSKKYYSLYDTYLMLESPD